MRFEGTENYVATDDLRVAVNAAIALERPLLIKGEPGTGKTVLAVEVAKALGVDLIEWHIKSTTKAQQGLYEYDAVSRLRDGQMGEERAKDVRNYIKKGKLWEAFVAGDRPILLIDEIDKADHEFESLLLEILSDFQVSIPEIGTIEAVAEPPLVFLTSNNTREISDALKRRCLHLYIPFPDADIEQRIISARVPEIPPELKRQLVEFIHELRNMDLKKMPAISETIDWARTLVLLHAEALDPALVTDTLNVILKFQEDIENVQTEVNSLTAKVAAG